MSTTDVKEIQIWCISKHQQKDYMFSKLYFEHVIKMHLLNNNPKQKILMLI